jgi:hypothetical protein
MTDQQPPPDTVIHADAATLDDLVDRWREFWQATHGPLHLVAALMGLNLLPPWLDRAVSFTLLKHRDKRHTRRHTESPKPISSVR